jgi:hypothetical protein
MSADAALRAEQNKTQDLTQRLNALQKQLKVKATLEKRLGMKRSRAFALVNDV